MISLEKFLDVRMRRKPLGLTMERCWTIVSELTVHCIALHDDNALHRKTHTVLNCNALGFSLHCTFKCVTVQFFTFYDLL